MKIRITRLTTRGRITIPAELREKYGFNPCRRVRFTEEKDGVKITPLAAPEEIKANIGF